MVLICPIVAPEEGLVYTTNNVKLKIGDRPIGKGVLYISQSTLAWQPDDKPDGMSVQWKQINVHGISTQPTKCIYFMIDHELQWPGVYDPRGLNGNAARPAAGNVEPMEQQAAGDENAPVDEDEDEGNVTDEEDFENPLTECWLLPDDINCVELIFRAMNDCQELNPDAADSISDESDFMDDEGEEGHFYVPNANNLHDGGDDDDDADGAQGGMRNLHINDADADGPP